MRVGLGEDPLDAPTADVALVDRHDSPVDRLTEREREALALRAEGRADAGIARAW